MTSPQETPRPPASQLIVRPFSLRPLGGQHAGLLSAAIIVIHEPTGIAVVEDSQRSQWQNRQAAEQRLAELVEAWNRRLSSSSGEPADGEKWSFARKCVQRGYDICVQQPDDDAQGLASLDATAADLVKHSWPTATSSLQEDSPSVRKPRRLVLCGNCGTTYDANRDEASHGTGKCGSSGPEPVGEQGVLHSLPKEVRDGYTRAMDSASSTPGTAAHDPNCDTVLSASDVLAGITSKPCNCGAIERAGEAAGTEIPTNVELARLMVLAGQSDDPDHDQFTVLRLTAMVGKFDRLATALRVAKAELADVRSRWCIEKARHAGERTSRREGRSGFLEARREIAALPWGQYAIDLGVGNIDDTKNAVLAILDRVGGQER